LKTKDRAYTVTRAEFFEVVEVKDIKSVINAEHELCETCIRFKDCDRFSCDQITYGVTK
jgi:hypothetical protein